MGLNLMKNRLARTLAAGIVLTTTSAAAAAAPSVKPDGVAPPGANGIPTSLAVPGFQIVTSGPHTIEPGPAEVAAQAPCPDGTLPISGGESNNSSAEVVLAGSLPNGSSWQASVRNTGSTPASFTVYAVCATIPGYEVFNSPVTSVPAGGVGSSRIPCPAGKMAMGGGPLQFGATRTSFVTSTSTFLRLEWATEIRNVAAGPRDLVTFATCVTDEPAYQIFSTDWIDIPADAYLPIALTCPAGMTALSAGVFVRDERAVITDFYPLTNSSWRLYLKNITTSNDQYHTSITCTL